ncbi:peripherin-2-like [Centruroides sculpturatus]|uniref:peripherin-2-like n=1 Tax=Centruroides sculpturatus TaxID=218467 RepID=UPI000C6E5E28|nr:peripherin-2-like [Centruroides sculpturatus]XP_023244784.1 peripherin-2-like [Centruroides sculpturatus]
MRILFTESERRIIGFCLLFLHIIMCFVYSVILLNRHNQIEYVEMNSLIGLNLENTEIFATILTHISIILHISGALISSNYSNAWNRWIFLNYFGYWILFYLMFFMSEVVFLLILISHFWELKPPWEFDIIPSMKKYRLSEDIKVMLDKLQINLKCCGGKGIGDWMDIAWIPRQVIIQRTGIENKLTAEWVPESCCNLTFDGPCYPKFVFKERKGITYYDTIEMFNSKGCNDVLPQYLLLLTKKIIWFIVVIMTIQLLIFILSRYILTSGREAHKTDDPTKSHIGWVFFYGDPVIYFKEKLEGNGKRNRSKKTVRKRKGKTNPEHIKRTDENWNNLVSIYSEEERERLIQPNKDSG